MRWNFFSTEYLVFISRYVLSKLIPYLKDVNFCDVYHFKVVHSCLLATKSGSIRESGDSKRKSRSLLTADCWKCYTAQSIWPINQPVTTIWHAEIIIRDVLLLEQLITHEIRKKVLLSNIQNTMSEFIALAFFLNVTSRSLMCMFFEIIL